MITLDIYKSVKNYRERAIVFWGSQYKVEESCKAMDYGHWLANLYSLPCGNVISREFANVCNDTPLPVVPFRNMGENNFSALCGVHDFTIELFTLDDKWIIDGFEKLGIEGNKQ